MEALIILLLIIALIMINSAKASTNKRIERLQHEIDLLRDSLKNISKPPARTEPVPPTIIVTPPAKKESDYWKSSFEVATSEEQQIHVDKTTPQPEPEFKKPEPVPVTPKPAPIIPPKPVEPPAPPKPGFFERNPDLEKFIGENLVSKIGIAILVLAIGFFVKYAIDNEWIGTVGRVAIGLICGGILVGIAHKLQKNYHAFSSVLVGGGLAIFYFTIFLAYREYHLFSSTVTFTIMLVITAFAVALALLYDRQEVAVIALVGGFASPFLASSGSGNYQALFIYLIILNVGLLVIAYYKAWRLLNLLAFLFTAILFWSWIGMLPGATPETTFRNGFAFATVFYLLFFAINIANNIRDNKKFIASDFGILLSNTALYFSVGLYCLAQMNATDYNGLFSASMGVFNLVTSYLLFRNRKIDPNILYLLIGVTLTFISLTAPLQLHENYITIFWASEAVLLYWLYQKSLIKILQISTIIIYVAMIISLVMDWNNVYFISNNSLPVIFNKGFITTVYSGAASYLLYWIISRSPVIEDSSNYFIKSKFIFRNVAFVLLYLAGLFEIIFQFDNHYRGNPVYLSYVQIYTFCFVLLLSAFAKRASVGSTAKAGLLSACIILYLFSSPESYSFQQTALTTQTLNGQFIITQILIALLAAVILYNLSTILRNQNAQTSATSSIPTWLLSATVIVYLSIEVHLFVNHVFYSPQTSLADIARVYNKTGLAILWGVSSFAFMWLGMRHKYRPLRIFSLTLFSLTLIKLFVFDISNIPVAGKIAAFFCLGVLLLVISFMYQRLKRLLIEDEKQSLNKDIN